jgi:hypothetical protein
MASSVAESVPIEKNFYEESGGRRGISAWLFPQITSESESCIYSA